MVFRERTGSFNCKAVCRSDGWTIEVTSKEKEGTEVIVRISPRLAQTEKEERTENTESEEKDYDFRGKRILVVEDNELNREIVKAVLEETGFEVEEAENGAVAVDKIKTAGALYYDVVLMDIQMPVMDGYMATKKDPKSGRFGSCKYSNYCTFCKCI